MFAFDYRWYKDSEKLEKRETFDTEVDTLVFNILNLSGIRKTRGFELLSISDTFNDSTSLWGFFFELCQYCHAPTIKALYILLPNPTPKIILFQ